MMVVPVNAEKNKAQYIAQKGRDGWAQLNQICSSRNLQFQHHNGYQDGNDGIAEGFKSSFAYIKSTIVQCVANSIFTGALDAIHQLVRKFD
jgi:hypothetical protein